MSRYRVELKASARKELEALPKAVAARVRPVLLSLADAPRPPGCLKLTGSERTYRVRVGDYRVIYDVYDKTLVVYVIQIADRKEAY